MSLTHILEAKPQNVIWGSIGGFKSPALTIQPGDSVLLHSISGEPGMNVPAAWIPDELTQLFESDVEKGPGAHILTGPIVIEGAQVGDTLAVTVDNIQVTAPFGFNYVGPMSGLRYFDYDDPEFTVMALDQEQQIAQFGKAKIPLHPFFGIMGVSPPDRYGRLTSVIPGRFGGNMDNKQLTSGTTVYFPVFKDGAYFYAGDGHGAQGDGEIDVTAIETSLKGTFTFELIKNHAHSWPYARRGNLLISMGFHEDLSQALKGAADQMIDLLHEQFGIPPKEAYQLCSMAADFHITQVANGVKGVHGLFDTSMIS